MHDNYEVNGEIIISERPSSASKRKSLVLLLCRATSFTSAPASRDRIRSLWDKFSGGAEETIASITPCRSCRIKPAMCNVKLLNFNRLQLLWTLLVSSTCLWWAPNEPCALSSSTAPDWSRCRRAQAGGFCLKPIPHVENGSRGANWSVPPGIYGPNYKHTWLRMKHPPIFLPVHMRCRPESCWPACRGCCKRTSLPSSRTPAPPPHAGCGRPTQTAASKKST